jgi:drug/metabolite transporter (DMT)-like permease
MFWLLLSILSALTLTNRDFFSKKILQHFNEYSVVFFFSLISVICYLPILFFIIIPILDFTFWIITIINGALTSVAFILYFRAIKLSPLSITIPMLAFTPIFLLVTSPIILGEFPSIWGLFGIFLIVLGTYIQSIEDVRKGFLAPFNFLIKEKGPILMLGVSFIYSIGSNLSKIGTQLSHPLVFSFANTAIYTVFLFPILLKKRTKPIKKSYIHFKTLFIIGLFNVLQTIFFMTALEIAIVPYVVSIRRTAIIFSTVYGFVFFKENRIKERLSGALIMVVGVVLITLLQ